MTDKGLNEVPFIKKLKMIANIHKQQCCSVTVIKMHACLGDAMDWRAPLYLEWGYV